MDEAVYQALRQILTEAGHSESSSEELAYHVALHFPEHGATLLRADPVEIVPDLPEQPTTEEGGEA